MKALTTEEIKQCELEILRDIDRVCRENQIKYSIGFGTLIGAIRHKGFIPWDDDIDIIMTRENYNKFIDVYYNKGNEKYSILDKSYYDNYYYQFAKIVDKRTIVQEKNLISIEEMGVWVDIFPIDYLNSTKAKKSIRRLEFYQKGLHRAKGDLTKSKRNIILKFIKKHIFINHKNFWYKMTIKTLEKETKKYKNDIAGVLLTDYPRKYLVEKNIFDNYFDVNFEGLSVMAIKDYDSYLKKIYGDYMEIPPVEKRQSHGFKAYWR